MARHFSNWIEAYMRFTSISEAPDDFHFWTAVSTIAGALRRKVWKNELHFSWTPNFYIIFCGPAGIVTKSTSLGIGFNLLRQIDGIHFGPDSMTWQGLGKKFEDAFEYAKYDDPQTGQEVLIPMSPLTCSVSELGTFLRPEDRELISFLTETWDGKERPFQHATAHSGDINVKNPWLNIIGATTPEWLQDNFPPSMLQQGIGSRIIFIYAEKKRHLVAYPSRVKPAADHFDIEQKLVDDLREIASMCGPYELTEEAYAWGEKWYEDHNRTRHTKTASSRYSGYLGRKQTHLHKIAMVFAAAQRNDLVIERRDLEMANNALGIAEGSMINVFENIGTTAPAKHVREIVQLIRAYKFLTYNQLRRLTFNTIPEVELKLSLQASVDAKKVEAYILNGVRGYQIKIQKTPSAP